MGSKGCVWRGSAGDTSIVPFVVNSTVVTRCFGGWEGAACNVTSVQTETVGCLDNLVMAMEGTATQIHLKFSEVDCSECRCTLNIERDHPTESHTKVSKNADSV